MGVNLKQNPDGSMGLQGNDGGEGGFIPVSFTWNAPVDGYFFIADRAYVVKSITARPRVVGSDGSAVTAVVKKAASATAITSGTALHSGNIDLKGTADTNQALTLSTTEGALDIAAGDAIGLDVTGTTTAAVGTVTVTLAVK